MNIRHNQAYSRGGRDWTEGFARAMADMQTKGGGELRVPAGEYPTGSIWLYDHMTLCIEGGAALRFHQDQAAFALIPLEFEGNAGLVHQACIYAEEAEDVTVTGQGVVDGQGSYWWDRLRAGENEVPRPYLVCFADCRHVTPGA